jgi:hypothetical protein
VELYDAAIPAVIADIAVLLSFLDGLVIDAKVRNELGPQVVPQVSATDRVASVETELQVALTQGAVIDNSVKDRVTDILNNLQTEIRSMPPALTSDQRQHIVRMCNGASTMMTWFANMMIILANAVMAMQVVPPILSRLTLTTVAIVALLVIYHVAHVAARGVLSRIDDEPVLGRIKLGTVLRIELLILNIAVFIQLASGISSSGPHG